MIDIQAPAASVADTPGRAHARTDSRPKGVSKLRNKQLARGGSLALPNEDEAMTERDKLIAFLFDRDDRKVENVKFFRGNAENLALEDVCRVAREVIADTWDREGHLPHDPPTIA